MNFTNTYIHIVSPKCWDLGFTVILLRRTGVELFIDQTQTHFNNRHGLGLVSFRSFIIVT